MIRIHTFFVAIVAIAILATVVKAQDEPLRPGRISREERDALRQGLRVEYMALGNSQTPADVSSARLAAIYVAEGQPPTPFSSVGPFRAEMTGYVKLRLRGEFDFSLAGRGKVKLSLNDAVVMEAAGDDLSRTKPTRVELIKGYNKLKIEYESPTDGDATMRLYWASDEFPAEPIFPDLLSHDGRDEGWAKGQTLRQGRLLFARNHCAKCHQPSEEFQKQLTSQASMPELKRDAPSLLASGQRLTADWIAQWMLDPAKLRNRTTMPRMLTHFSDAEAQQHAADLAAYLTQQKDGTFQPLAAAEGDEAIDTGEALFEDRGCIACHRFSEVADEEEEYDRVSLHYVNAKYQPAALASFLKDTRHYYHWSGMPKFELTDAEAAALAAYLRKRSTGTLTPLATSQPANAQRGAKLFTSIGCANCHSVDVDGTLNATPNKKLSDLDATQGCLQADGENAPQFPFDDAQRTALTQFLKTSTPSLLQETPAEFSRRQYNVIGCNACHSRDDADADLPYALLDYGERGLPAEPVPDLTWAGEKLRPDWTRRLLLGEIPYRPRPHFKIRMPAFPERGKLLSQGLSAEHGFAPDEDARPKFNAELAKTGEAVAAMHTGLACHRCHAIGDKQATAPFEARSTNLSYASDRLRYGFYHRWMHDPLRIDPQTKMIKFAQDGEKTGLTNIEGGDARKQFEAVWHYLQRLNENEKK